jgi:ankyrin repeat protein
MVRLLAGWIVVMGLFAGCAQIPTGSVDSDGLHNAIAVDDAGFVEDAVRSGKIDMNHRVRTPGYREGAPLIVIAARYASLEVMRYLIRARADINARTDVGETALMLASYFNAEDNRGAITSERYEQAVRMLVEAGANLENEPHNYTPLAYAAHQGHNRIVRYLIERGARVDADAQDGTIYVNTPLMMAAIQGHMDTALWLLRAGADARVRIHMGHTAAELALKYRHQNMAGALRCAESLAPGETFAQKCASALSLRP